MRPSLSSYVDFVTHWQKIRSVYDLCRLVLMSLFKIAMFHIFIRWNKVYREEQQGTLINGSRRSIVVHQVINKHKRRITMYQLKKKYMKDVRLQKNLRRRVETQVGEVSSNATHFFFLQYRITNYTCKL